MASIQSPRNDNIARNPQAQRPNYDEISIDEISDCSSGKHEKISSPSLTKFESRGPSRNIVSQDDSTWKSCLISDGINQDIKIKV